MFEKLEGKIPLGRPRCRWEDNIRMNQREIGWEGVDWMHSGQDEDQWWVLVSTVMNLWVQEGGGGDFLAS